MSTIAALALLSITPVARDARKLREKSVVGVRWMALAVLAAAGMLTGCSPHPEDIPAQNVSDFQFMRFSCGDLAKVQTRLQEVLITASNEQNQAHIDDIYGYIFTLMPLARLSGRNLEPRIALYKGELNAVQRAAQAKRCEYSPT